MLTRLRSELSFFHGELPILTFHTKSLDAQQLFFKRTLDIVAGLAGVIATACLFPMIALAIRSDSPGPIFFGQKRIGESGRVFHCWKYRTMFVGAESRQEELSSRNEMNGAVFKIRDDPRITAVGRWLRRTSLDELPQFWNVLKGEMSLVGTRPPTPAEVGLYENWHRRRISIKPGITGLWQVSGRNNIVDFDEIVRLDLDYIDNWSLWLDLRILLRTVKVVLAWEGR
jgi:exopolysaccharide biosynthesis polyprenyl glycosylphosphotransferase